MRKTIFLSILLCLIGALYSNAQIERKELIHFDHDDSDLKPEEKSKIESFIETLQSLSGVNLRIIGHTDQDGNPDYNQKLSKERAEQTLEHIRSLGYPIDNVEIAYHGESHLLSQSDSETSKETNRRVELIANINDYSTVQKVFSHLVHENQSINVIDPKKENHIELPKGTKLNIPSHAFEYADGTPVDDAHVSIECVEALSYADMLMHNLATQTEEGMIETGGMVNLSANANGQEVQLREGKFIEISLPAKNSKDGMQVFTPVQTGEVITWEPTNQSVSIEEYRTKTRMTDVDLSPLLDYQPVDRVVPTLHFEEMPPMPRKKRKPYPPSKYVYSKKKYDEVYAKYERKLAEYQQSEKEFNRKWENWISEIRSRTALIRDYRDSLIANKLNKRLAISQKRLEDNIDKKPQDKLVVDLFGFIYKPVGKINLNSDFLFKKAFKHQLKNVQDHYNLPEYNDYVKKRAGAWLSSFSFIYNRMNSEINYAKCGRKYCDPYMDVMRTYVFKTDRLDWINCDRFLDIPKEELTNLEIANADPYTKYYLIFKDIKSMIVPIKSGKVAIFRNIPIGEKVRIAAIKTEDNQIHFDSKDMIIKANQTVAMDLHVSRLNDLKEALGD